MSDHPTHRPSRSPHDLAADRLSMRDLSESERHRVLSDERRRVILEVLRERTFPVGLSALAEAVAAREDGPDPLEDLVERVRVALHHHHLPVLADLNVVEYDWRTRRVE